MHQKNQMKKEESTIEKVEEQPKTAEIRPPV